MNIVYIIPEMSHPGGIGRITQTKINILANKGHNITIITEIQGSNTFFYNIDKRIQHFDINLCGKNKIIKYFLRRKRIKKILHEIRPDIVVHTYTFSPIKCAFKYKSVLECHFNHNVLYLKANGSLSSRIKAFIMTKYQEHIVKKFDIFVVLTQEDQELWKKSNIKSNIVVIPNMVPSESITEYSQQPMQEIKRAIAVGRLDGQKSFDRLIRIWAKVCETVKDWKLNIYGKGPDKKAYEQLINELGLSNNITIKEPIKNIHDEYLKSSFLCMTSKYEGFGLVLAEAMSCGIPVISYNTPCGPKDIIENGKNGFLIKENDEEQYAKSIITLITDMEMRKRMGQYALESAKKFDPKNIMEGWEKLFDQLIQK